MTKRRYHQHCGVARALDVVGSRWTLLIVRNLLLGPLRFTDLRRGLPGITTNLLADRLKEMEAEGLIERVRAPRSRSDRYALTERGRALEPAILELGRWGWPYMSGREPDDHVDPAWGMLALKRRFVPGPRSGLIELTLSGMPFTVGFGQGDMTVRRGATPEADAGLVATWPTMAAILYGGASLAEAERSEALVVRGRRAALRAFADAFGLEQ